MKTVIIDGNNLIHKVPALKSLFLKDKTSAQISLVEKIKTRMSGNDKYIIIFDGHGNNSGFTKFHGLDIFYSGNETADNRIKEKIKYAVNNKTLKVVSSDLEITEFARLYGCEIQDSDNFRDIMFKNASPAEGKNINQNFIYDQPEKPDHLRKKDIEEFKKLFS